MAEERIAVLTIQAARPGGIPTVVDWWHHFLQEWGHDPVTVYAAFDEREIGLAERLLVTLRSWRASPNPDEPTPTLTVAAPPVPLWLFYFVPQFLIGPLFNRFDAIVYAGGPVLGALPLTLRGIPTVLWMGTLYEDEIAGKVAAGDPWAERVYNSPFWPFLRWQERLVLRQATYILAQSPYTQRRIREVVPVAEPGLAMVPVPVADTAAGRMIEGRYLLNVSRINDPRKNIPLLLEAFAHVHQAHPDVRLVLAGDEPSPALIAQVEGLGLAGAVLFRGKVSAAELRSLYQYAEVFVISSAQEGLGIVMVEAMAHGVPVVATDCGGPEGIVVTGRTGHLVPNGDRDALAAALTGLLADPALRLQLGEGAHAFVQEHATPQAVGQALRPPVERLLGQQERSRPVMSWIAAGWAVLIFVAYMVHQMRLLWPSIRDQLLVPALGL
ncbi:MAG: glycosyltransferase family 4 protein [Chloroflexi bacterium]|nr:glycosyltransferase family 4 protein [Chloroflexota bacterium]